MPRSADAGRRNSNSMWIYMQLIGFENDDYQHAFSKTLREDQELVEAGFGFVTERDGIKIYRKRK